MTDLSISNNELKDFDFSTSENNIQDDDMAHNSAAVEDLVPTKPAVFGFDYAGLSREVVEEAEATADRIRSRHRASIIDTGNDLCVIKKKLEHGKFGSWLTYHFGMSERTAQNYMNAAEVFGSVPKVIDVLTPTTVYKLAAKGAPPEIRHHVIEAVANGRLLDRKEIESRIATAQSVERQKREDERAARQEQRAWQKHEQDLRSAGKSDDEIENERKRWATKKAQKERAAQQKSSEAKQREEAASRREEKMKEIAARAAKTLKARLGSDYEKLRDALLQINYSEFCAAMQQA